MTYRTQDAPEWTLLETYAIGLLEHDLKEGL